MSKKISKIDKFNCKNVVTLNAHVSNNRYLVLDLWENDNNEYKQIFLQINNLKVINFNESRVYFDLTNRSDVINAMFAIEDHMISILKVHLCKLRIKHRAKDSTNFRSVIKNNKNTNAHILVLNLVNQDYNVNVFDSNKKQVDIHYFTKQNTTFNVILEFMYI